MTAPIYTGYQQSLTYAASKDRHIINGPMLRRATANAISGVIPQGQSGLYASRSGFNVTVENGAASVSGYWFVMDGNTTLTVAATTGVARRDLIIARIYDTSAGDGISEGKLEIVKGTTTSDPAIPTRSLLLWQVDVPASGPNVTLVDRRVYTVAAGAVRPTKGIANLVVADQMAGMPLFDTDTGITWYRYGSTLYRQGAVQVAAGVINSNTTVEVRNTWYYKQFGPIVLPSPANVVVVQGTFTLNFVASAAFDLAGAWGNVDLFRMALDPYSSGTDTERTYSFTGTIKDRAAGSHDLCWLGLTSGAGAIIHVKNLSYSWVAYG